MKITVFEHLKMVFLEICFWDRREILTGVSLFQNALTLKELELQVCLHKPQPVLLISLDNSILVLFTTDKLTKN
uniref:Uncharacterized protein n=1 Tax=Oryza brachyantha TaxID=4533 RepID=J3MKK6_ORYBR